MFSMLARHWDVLKAAWAEQDKRRTTKKSRAETDFLPAALEILERPPSPLGRVFFWTIVAFFVIALAWAIFGRVDVVAVAPAKTVPRERVKVIQAAELGVVRGIHVTDGQTVAEGDPLLELDPSIAGADEAQARQQLVLARVDIARAQALLDYQDTHEWSFAPPEGAPPDMAARQRALIRAHIDEFAAQIATLDKQLDEARADLAVIERELVKLSETLPLVDEQVTAREILLEKGLTPRLLVLELKERQIAMRQDMGIARERRAKAVAAIEALDRRTEQVRQEFRKDVLAEMAEAEARMMLAEQELAKATSRFGLQTLTAPVDGVVQQLAVHTLGGVVQPAEPLMVVVPGAGELIVEASVLNKDIGFVHTGDVVEVKFEAFQFTKYGVVHGTIENISLDAVQDEQMGLIYQARIRLDEQHIYVQGRDVPLAAGMSATAEIKTGTRRLVEYVLSPLLRYRDESFRER